MLARTSHDLCEQAADDAVLRSNIPSADYADILVRAARNSTPPLLLAANGVAPSSSSLGRRVLNVLDRKRSRIPVRLGWSAICVTAACGLGTAMAAVQPLSSGPSTATRGNYGPAAAAELERMGTPQTIAIARAISGQDWEARRSQAETRFNHPEAAKPLISALRDESPVTRRVAVWGISEARPPRAEAPVSSLLQDDVPEVRAEAARALGDLGAIGRSSEIAKLLQDESALVRRQAAHALGDLQDPATRPALEASLTDGDLKVRAKAAWALRQVAEAEAILRRYGRR
jgi:HEAT repeat protein